MWSKILLTAADWKIYIVFLLLTVHSICSLFLQLKIFIFCIIHYVLNVNPQSHTGIHVHAKRFLFQNTEGDVVLAISFLHTLYYSLDQISLYF